MCEYILGLVYALKVYLHTYIQYVELPSLCFFYRTNIIKKQLDDINCCVSIVIISSTFCVTNNKTKMQQNYSYI